MKIIFLSDASIEFREAVKYYNNERHGLGFEFANEVKATLSRIRQYPDTWIEIENGIRSCMVKRFPFTLLYAVENDQVIIIAIMHMKRFPGYWKDRSYN